MSRLTIKIKKETIGYIVEASNGDLPFEGRTHADKAAACRDIESAYSCRTWDLRKQSNGNYSIKID